MDGTAKLLQAPAITAGVLSAAACIVCLWPRDYQIDAQIDERYLNWVGWLTDNSEEPLDVIEQNATTRASERTATNYRLNRQKLKWLARSFLLVVFSVVSAFAGALMRMLLTCLS